MREIVEAVLLAASLCADCFAVAVCSSVTLKKISWKEVGTVSLVFACVHVGLMSLGWAFGDLFVGYVSMAAHVIGFLLLLYVGGSMIFESLRKDCQVRNLNGLANILLSALATSIDAFAVGISLSMEHLDASTFRINCGALFIVTLFAVTAGMSGGHRIGHRYGKIAELIGGIVILLIGFRTLFQKPF